MKEELKNFLSLKCVSIQKALCRRLPNTQTALYVRFQERDSTNLAAAADARNEFYGEFAIGMVSAAFA